MAAVKKVVKKRKDARKVDKGQVHIQASFNNTLVTITDMQGNTVSGLVLVALDLKAQEKAHLLPHKWQQKPLERLQENKVCVL